VSDGTYWLERAARIRAIAQTGLAYTKDPYDRERYEELTTIGHDLIAAAAGTDPQAVRNLYLPEHGYPTPKIDVRAGVFREEKVLLVRESADGRWTLPGGWGDEHEPPSRSVEREVQEESGYRVRASRLVAVKDRHLHPYEPRRLERIYKLFFLCDLEGGAAATSLETDAVGWFALNALPELSIGRTLPEDIECLSAFRGNPARPCYFD
jgi:ADP-ribose pyrophosphatase YjhB (NUDIX family)